jgi:hypothetical protein
MQGSAYPFSTTTCRLLPRRVAGHREHPRAAQGRFMQHPASELRRILLPRTRVYRAAEDAPRFGIHRGFIVANYHVRCRPLIRTIGQTKK